MLFLHAWEAQMYRKMLTYRVRWIALPPSDKSLVKINVQYIQYSTDYIRNRTTTQTISKISELMDATRQVHLSKRNYSNKAWKKDAEFFMSCTRVHREDALKCMKAFKARGERQAFMKHSFPLRIWALYLSLGLSGVGFPSIQQPHHNTCCTVIMSTAESPPCVLPLNQIHQICWHL